jgi:hypothetical protein
VYQDWASQAYIYAGYNYNVNWGLADKITGYGAGDVNAIWYMMLLGSDAGWDLPGYRCPNDGQSCDTPGSDPVLQQLPYNEPSSENCYGNGSTNGHLPSNGFSQTLSQRLTMAQQNLRHVTASEASGILEHMRKLKQDARATSPNGDVEIDLTSPLREAATLIERAKLPGGRRPGQEGSVSATTPTHLMELFIKRAQLHIPELGPALTEDLLTKSYELIAELEGQNQPGKAAVTRSSR